MEFNFGKKLLVVIIICCCGGCSLLFGAEQGVQTLHLVQDDAQDCMVSKIYVLKYVQANDITPFVLGMVKRYNMNSSVNCIQYGTNNEEILTVTCPVRMMPYVDEFIRLVDRDIRIDGHTPGDIIKGTGITRAVYQPRYRSGQVLVDIINNAVIGEGPCGSLYGYDQNSNQIYWKDNSSNTSYVFQFLGWLDRPPPQITFHLTLTEVRESTFRDLGIEYLAWKNGPGLNLFQAGFNAFSLDSAGTAALTALSGGVGGFFFAPKFDASFIRLLQQSGHAEVKSEATLTVTNSADRTYSLQFNPQLQNIVKSDNDKMSVIPGSAASRTAVNGQLSLQIIQPIANLHYGEPQSPYPDNEEFSFNNDTPGAYGRVSGTLFFGYQLQAANVVERSNTGEELLDVTSVAGNVTVPLNKERIIAEWDKTERVETTIGIPFLCEIPVFKYLFSTTTASMTRTRVYLTLKTELLNASKPDGFEIGKVLSVHKRSRK